MRKPDAPCKGCKKRRHLCHAMCVEYAAFMRDNEAYKKQISENKAKNNALEEIGIRRSLRAKKSAGMKK